MPRPRELDMHPDLQILRETFQFLMVCLRRRQQIPEQGREDIAGDSVVIIWSKWPQAVAILDGLRACADEQTARAAYFAWCRAIVNFKARDAIKRKSFLKEVFEVPENLHSVGVPADQEAIVILAEICEKIIQQTVQKHKRISADKIECAVRRKLYGETSAEIARDCGISRRFVACMGQDAIAFLSRDEHTNLHMMHPR